MAIELVVFDMAGTTVDDGGGAVNRCFREALGSAGLSVAPDRVDAVMGLHKPEAIRLLLGSTPGGDALLGRVESIHDDFVARMLRFYRDDPSIREVPGASDVFARLRRSGIKVALNTGFNRPVADAILGRLGWAVGPVLDATVTSDEVARGRPHPDMIDHFRRVLGVDDRRSVAKVGDAPADLREGTNAGCALVVGVTAGTHTRAQLEAHPHTHLIETVAELPALLGLGSLRDRIL